MQLNAITMRHGDNEVMMMRVTDEKIGLLKVKLKALPAFCFLHRIFGDISSLRNTRSKFDNFDNFTSYYSQNKSHTFTRNIFLS